MVVELEIPVQATDRFSNRAVIFEIHLLPLDRTPQPLDKGIIERPTAPIPTNLNACLFQPAGVGATGELAALIGVENLGLAHLQRRVEGLQTEPSIERIGQLPAEHIATVPIEDCHQIEKALLHPHVGNIGAPDVIFLSDRATTQQVRIASLAWGRNAGVGLGIGASSPMSRNRRRTRLGLTL